MYNDAKESLMAMAKSLGNKELLHSLISDDFYKVQSILGSNEHMAKLKQWSELYRKRRGLSLEDVRRKWREGDF